ncbi:hypothetical protein [Cyanobium sp. AMD-g]|nr:hypothetical protein [Cyanobium sp. AMD-g]
MNDAATDKAKGTILKGKGCILKGGKRSILTPRAKKEAVLTEEP